MAQSTIAKLFVELGFNDQEFQSGVKGAGKGLSQLGAAGGQLSNMFGGVVTKAFQAATVAVTGFAAASAVVGAKFEQEMATVGAVSGANRVEMEALTDQARKLGRDTTFSATEAASAMQELARAGMASNEVIQASEPALLLAGAASADMSLATASMSATLAQFSLSAEDGGRVADVFSTALRGSLFDLSSLTEAMKFAGTVGAGFGMSLEETVAAVAQFRDLGLEGSMAGTQFRMMMAGAASVTAKGERVLAKYGLTQSQINPETNSFADILRTVGEAGIGATDSLAIFGKKGGANVALLAKHFVEGSSTYDELLVKLETSAGNTATMYEEMTNTVFSQFTILGSATQELMLSVFDTYKGPLLDLLRTLGDTVNFVAEEFNRNAEATGASVGSMLRSIQTTVEVNRRAIADAFITIAEGVTKALQILVTLGPVLDEIAIALLAMFAVGQILSFIATLGSAVQAIIMVKGAVISLTAAVSAATGGFYLIVVAIGLVVTGLVTLATSFGTAQQAAEEYEAARAGQTKREEEAAAAYESGVASMVTATQAMARAREQELTLSGTLTDSYGEELTALQGMTAEQLAAGEAAGTLVRVNEDGVEVFKSLTMLQEESTNSSLGQADALDAVTTKQRQLARAVSEAESAQVSGQATLDEYNATLDEYGAGIAQGILGAKGFANVSELRVFLDESKIKGEEATKALDKLTGAMRQVQHEASQSDIIRELADAEESEAEAAKRAEEAQKKYAQALKSATTARQRAAESVTELIADALATEEQATLLAMDAKLTEIGGAFQEEIDLRRGNASKVLELETQRDDALETVRMAFRLRSQAETTRAHDAEVASLLDLTGSEQSIRERARQEEIASLQTKFAQEAALYESGSSELVQVREREAAAVETTMAKHRQEDKARVREHQTTVDQITQSGASARVDRLRAIEIQGQQALLQLEGASLEQRMAVKYHFADLVVAEEEKIRRDVVALTNSRAGEVQRLEEEKAQALLDIPEEFGAERAAVAEHYDGKIKDAHGSLLERLGEKPGVQGFLKAMDTMGKAVGGVVNAVGAIGDAMGKAMGGLEAMTGFSFNLLDAVGDVTATMEDAADQRAALDEQLAAGELTPEEYKQAMADLPASAAEAAGDYVTELVSGAVGMVQTFVEAAPILLQELAAQLPTLLQSLAEAIPQIVDSLVTAIPQVVTAVVESLPTIVMALAEAIPTLVQTVVDQIPTIIEALGAALPVLIGAVTEAITILIAALPDIIRSILEQLPAIILALLESVELIIMALVEAIPLIIAAVIDNLPTIIMALVDGILSLVITLIEQIPILVVAIVEQIPHLIQVLLSELLPNLIISVLGAIPEIVMGLIRAIPTIVLALILAIPQIITELIAAIPVIFTALVQAIPELIITMVTLLVTELPTIVVEFVKALVQGLIDGMKALIGVFGDIFKAAFKGVKGLFSGGGKDGKGKGGRLGDAVDAVKSWFSDTPGPVYTGGKAMTATFAPGDYVIAARDPANLIKQAMSLSGGLGLEPGAMEIPSVSGLAQAILQSGSVGGAGQATGTDGVGGPIQVTVTAEGRTLDEVLYLGAKRGGTPRLDSMMKRSTVGGAHVGLSRGRYSPSS